jgi:hypothetical protein
VVAGAAISAAAALGIATVLTFGSRERERPGREIDSQAAPASEPPHVAPAPPGPARPPSELAAFERAAAPPSNLVRSEGTATPPGNRAGSEETATPPSELAATGATPSPRVPFDPGPEPTAATVDRGDQGEATRRVGPSAPTRPGKPVRPRKPTAHRGNEHDAPRDKANDAFDPFDSPD